jgi:hypothetical protein
VRVIHRLGVLIGCVLTIVSSGCRAPSPASAPSTAPSSPRPAPAAPSSGEQADQSGPPILPDPKLTPGATLPVTTDDICVPGYTRVVRDVPSAVKRQAYAEYGVASHQPREYEVDHLISLELGGSNSIRNLWPQSYRTEPWNARVKDSLENELHEQVCSGQLDLATAQREIAANWIEAYKKYFHTDRPLADSKSHHRRRSAPAEAATEGASPPPAASPERATSPTGRGEVWVNTRSGKYFRPGSRYYGKTREGDYMSEAQAQRSGYQAARGD